MDIGEIKYRNFLILCRKFNCDTPKRLMNFLDCTKQHASALLNNKSPIGKATINTLAKKWGINPQDFYQEELGGGQKQTEQQQGNDLTLSILAGRVDDLSKRVDAQGIILQIMGTDSLEIKNDIKEIFKLMNIAADAKDMRKLKKVG